MTYVHISDQGRNKLDPKSKNFTFINYDEDDFCYRICDDDNKKNICSRYVILNERVMYKDMHNTWTNNPEPSGLVYAYMDDIPESPIVENP